MLGEIVGNTQVQFCEWLKCPVLVDTVSVGSPMDAGFHTEIADSADFLGADGSAGADEMQILPIRKSGDSPYSDWVSLGRTRRNDIQLFHQGISKFHAFFVEQDGVWNVVDAGSRNGTFVDGTQLAARSPCALDTGAVLAFGGRSLRFLTAAALYDMVMIMQSVGGLR